jgi:hypothetical protein
MSPSPADRWLPAILFLGTLAYLLPLRAHGLSMNDDGWWLQAVLRMRDGEVLYRDVWVFYAPLVYHAIDWIFALTGPSMLAGRVFFALCIAASAAMTYRLARRFVAPAWAWIPPAVHALAPGPWHKAYYGMATVAILLCTARALERTTAWRFGALGGVVGIVLATRQDLGLLGLAIALGAAVVPALCVPVADRAPAPALRRVLAVVAGVALPVAPVLAAYASAGALGDLYEAAFVRAFGQSGAHPDSIGRALAPATFAQAPQGRAVGVLMLLPIPLYAALGAVAVRRFARRPADPRNLLLGALLLFGVAGLLQAWYPMLLLRLLQSALPFLLAATLAFFELGRRFNVRAALPALVAAAAAYLGVVFTSGEMPLYTGSARVLRYDAPVEILGERFYERWSSAEEIRLVRNFFATHAEPGEPTLGLPTLSLYNPILGRPNPTRFLAEHPKGNFVMSAAQKRDEGARLLASGARFVIVGQDWYARGSGDDPLLSLLRNAFHPVRGYRSVLILARGSDAEWAAASQRMRRTIGRQPDPAELEFWSAFAEQHPDEPLAWRVLAAHQEAAADLTGAIDSLGRAAALDPAEPLPLEVAARLHLTRGDRAAAREALARARAVRESPETRRLARTLADGA